LGGSHFALVNELDGGQVPTVDLQRARETFFAIHRAIHRGLVQACHDLSEGGLAVAATEMAFAGGLGARIDVATMPTRVVLDNVGRLFSESNSRFLCEVPAGMAVEFEQELAGVPAARIGVVTGDSRLAVLNGNKPLIDADIHQLKETWQATFRW
jgi:phosphoribosylformylglycinamidine synthase